MRQLITAFSSFLTRYTGNKTVVKSTHFSSKAYGTRDSRETVIDGRLQLDIFQVMQRDYKLRSYSLNAVCAQFLGEQKEDVHHSVITELQNGTDESRRRLAVYCLKVRSKGRNAIGTHLFAARTRICPIASWTSYYASSTIPKWHVSQAFPLTTFCQGGNLSRWSLSYIAKPTQRTTSSLQ